MKWLLGRLWAFWKRVLHLWGTFVRFVLLTVFYFVLVNLFNLVLRLFRIDLLDRRLRPVPTYWRQKEEHDGATYRHQF